MMEDDGLVLSLGIKSFGEKRPRQTPPPSPSLSTPPLKHSSSISCKNSIFYKVDHFHKPTTEVGGSKTKLGAYTRTTQNVGWASAKQKARNSQKGLDRAISKFLDPNSELSMCVWGGKRDVEREVIISDGEDDGDADHRRDVEVVRVAVAGGPEKKKLRLSKEQSSLLEQTFLEHSTLNNKQKLYLAKELKLTPRQVEVWFQNRRARTKLKQTEVDCEFLKEYCKRLSEENRRLQKEVQQLRPPSAIVVCHACSRGSTPSSTADSRRTLDTTIRPLVHQSNVPASFFNSPSLLNI